MKVTKLWLGLTDNPRTLTGAVGAGVLSPGVGVGPGGVPHRAGETLPLRPALSPLHHQARVTVAARPLSLLAGDRVTGPLTARPTLLVVRAWRTEAGRTGDLTSPLLTHGHVPAAGRVVLRLTADHTLGLLLGQVPGADLPPAGLHVRSRRVEQVALKSGV